MDSDLTQNQEISTLQQQLSEALVAEDFFNHSSGKLLEQLFVKQITRLTRDVTSDKYLKDHVGYCNAVLELNAYKMILKSLQVAGAPARVKKLREKLGERENV